ncbi:MAG TPA: BlaI/MecI/CopY family transcriptional regulator [Gemmatimonadaceae bacterium]|nr:BlaI/MecI/CopY family transcriptional regulator [Gemmatimonadaceae bacterium]
MTAAPKPAEDLTRRERQVMDILHRRGESTVAEIMAELPDPPTYSAVRSILRILGEKQMIEFREDGPRYVYFPSAPTEQAQADVLDHVVRTYFAGSTEQAVTALLRLADTALSDDELQSLRARIAGARQNGR